MFFKVILFLMVCGVLGYSQYEINQLYQLNQPSMRVRRGVVATQQELIEATARERAEKERMLALKEKFENLVESRKSGRVSIAAFCEC